MTQQKIYVRATKRLVDEMVQRVLKQMSQPDATIVEFLLNEKGFTMDKHKASYEGIH